MNDKHYLMDIEYKVCTIYTKIQEWLKFENIHVTTFFHIKKSILYRYTHVQMYSDKHEKNVKNIQKKLADMKITKNSK